MGQVLQMPAALRPAERKTETLRLRIAPSERDRLVEAARAAGFRSISEYVRCLANTANTATGPRSGP